MIPGEYAPPGWVPCTCSFMSLRFRRGWLLADAGRHAAHEEPLAGEVDEDHRQDGDERAREHEGLVGRVAALEEREPGHQRALVLVLEEHQCDQELVPDPDRV